MSKGAEGQRQKAEDLPEGWREIVLEDAAEKIMVGIASAATHAYAESGIIMIRNLNIKEGWIDKSDLLHITEDYEKAHRNKRIKCGDVLTVRTGYPGVSAVADETLEGAQCFTSLITRPKKNLLESDFLCYYINSSIGKNFILGAEAGGAQKNVNAGSLEKMPLLLPPLPEQRKIAAILSTWDDSLATLTNLLAAKRQQKRGLAEALLTGKKRLPGFEGEWESHLLGLLMPQKPKETAGETEYPILSVTVEGIKPQGDHFNKRVASEKTSDYLVVRRGEIAMSGLNFWMGAIDMQTIEDAGVISPAYKVFRTNPKKFNSDFARHFIRSEKMRQILLDSSIQGASIVRRNLDMQSLKESEVMVPTVPEQQAIASILSTLDGEIASLEALKAKVQEQKRGLMDELLTGRVRVKVEEAC